MNQMQRQVLEFYRKFGHPVGPTPGFQRAEFRARLIIEEAVEAAVGMIGSVAVTDLLEKEILEFAKVSPKAPNFIEAIDGIGDSLYVQFGAAIEFGVNMEPIFDEIHRSQYGQGRWRDARKDGKTLKPPGGRRRNGGKSPSNADGHHHASGQRRVPQRVGRDVRKEGA